MQTLACQHQRMISGDVCKHSTATIPRKCSGFMPLGGIMGILCDIDTRFSSHFSEDLNSFPPYFMMRDLSTFCNKLPINQHLFLPVSRFWCMYSSYQNKANSLQKRSLQCCQERYTPCLQCFQYCEISVCTVVALNYKPFQCVEIFVWLLFDSSDNLL